MAAESARVLPRPTPGAPPVPTVPRPHRLTLDGGLRVVFVHRPALPQLFARLVVPAGAAADPPGAPGTASLAGDLLLEGTANRSPTQLHERIDLLGAALTSRVGHDFAEIDISLLGETLEEGLGLLAEVVAAPSFPEREVERIRAETLDALDARLDEPANVADDRAAEAVFGPSHPYGRLAMGDAATVARLTRDDLARFHAARYRPGGSVLVLAGDLNGADMPRVLERAFGGWSGSVPATEYPAQPERPLLAGSLDAVVWEDAAQAEIRVAGMGMPRADRDWVAGAVANYILGGSTITGRLGANLREDKGWTYGVRCGFAAGVQAGGWVVETAVDGSAGGAALVEIQREIERLIADSPEPEELERAKEALILSLPRAFETPGRIVARLATVEAYGLPADYWATFPDAVRRVDAAAVAGIAERYFTPGSLVRVTVGPAVDARAAAVAP